LREKKSIKKITNQKDANKRWTSTSKSGFKK